MKSPNILRFILTDFFLKSKRDYKKTLINMSDYALKPLNSYLRYYSEILDLKTGKITTHFANEGLALDDSLGKIVLWALSGSTLCP